MNFFRDKDCGKILLELTGGENCTNEALEFIEPNKTDAATEKHVPVVSVQDGMLIVNVGSIAHPMTAEHYIEWIYLKTSFGGVICNLNPTDEPQAIFTVAPEEVESVYIYCNLHGLWKAKEPVLPNQFEVPEGICSAEFTQGCINEFEQ